MYSKQRIGVVVPAYNEELLIKDTLQSIPPYVDKIYVIDDCSVDNTKKNVHECSTKDPRIQYIKHLKNSGVGAAITSGFKAAIIDNMDVVAVMAGDNQMDPKYLPYLLDPIIWRVADFTKGNRLKFGYWKGMGPWRLFGNILLSLLTKLASGYWNIQDPQNGYVAISIQSLKKIDLNSLYNGYAFENDLMVKANIAELPMLNADIPAKYGEETSNIKYPSFIINTGIYLLKAFFQRIRMSLIKRFNLAVLLYLISICLILFGLFFALFGEWRLLIISVFLFIFACILESTIYFIPIRNVL